MSIICPARGAQAAGLKPVAACTSANLGASLSLQGAAGSRGGEITYRNISRHLCWLQGRPKLDLRTSSNQHLLIAYRNDAMHASKVVVRSNGRALSLFLWHNWCGAPVRAPLHLLVTLPRHGGTLAAQWKGGLSGEVNPPCLAGKHSRSSIDVGPFSRR